MISANTALIVIFNSYVLVLIVLIGIALTALIYSLIISKIEARLRGWCLVLFFMLSCVALLLLAQKITQRSPLSLEVINVN